MFAHRFDPLAMSEYLPLSALEIAAAKGNTEGTGDYREQGRNLLQFLALEGKTAYRCVSFTPARVVHFPSTAG